MSRPSKKKQGRYLCAPLSVLIDDRLSKSERLVLMGLYSFHDYKADRPVFPSRTALAKRSDLNDADRVGKLTTGLAEKGWVSKKRKGFTNLVDYRLHVPPYVMWQMFGIELCKLAKATLSEPAEITVQAETTVQAKTTLSEQVKTTLPEQAETTCYKEHTILTNHINKPHMGGSDLFDRFWNEYPKQVGRKKAHQTWQSMNPSEQDLNAMLINISDRLNQGAWSLETKKFIPHASNYLEGEQWTDEIITRNNNGQDTNGNKLSAADRVKQALEQQSRQQPIQRVQPERSWPVLVNDG